MFFFSLQHYKLAYFSTTVSYSLKMFIIPVIECIAVDAHVFMFLERLVNYSWCQQKMMSFRGQVSSAKMTSPGGKLKALTCHPTKRVTKTDVLTYFLYKHWKMPTLMCKLKKAYCLFYSCILYFRYYMIHC